MKSDTTKNAAQDNQKTSITKTAYRHIPGLKLERKTTKKNTRSADLILAVYKNVLGQQG
jgi:hypothetical protein